MTPSEGEKSFSPKRNSPYAFFCVSLSVITSHNAEMKGNALFSSLLRFFFISQFFEDFFFW